LADHVKAVAAAGVQTIEMTVDGDGDGLAERMQYGRA
jgi:hypothetical protein